MTYPTVLLVHKILRKLKLCIKEMNQLRRNLGPLMLGRLGSYKYLDILIEELKDNKIYEPQVKCERKNNYFFVDFGGFFLKTLFRTLKNRIFKDLRCLLINNPSFPSITILINNQRCSFL